MAVLNDRITVSIVLIHSALWIQYNDDQMLTLAKEGRTLQQIAVELCVPEDLLLIELEDYGKLHPDYIFRFPRIPKGNYLKDYILTS